MMLYDCGLQTVGYLPHLQSDIDLLSEWRTPQQSFLILPELTKLFAGFEIFSKHGPIHAVDPSTMIPICLDNEYGENIFLVQFFDDDSRVIRRAPVTRNMVLEEIKPILDAGTKPILFTAMRDPYDAAISPFSDRIALERTIGFLTEGDAILAQVIAETRRMDEQAAV